MNFSWKYTGVRVQDLDAAIRFYRDGLGMRVRFKFKIKETGGTVVELVSGEGKHFLELNWYPPGSAYATPYTPGEAMDHLAFRVKGATIEEAIAHLEAHGGKLLIPPFPEGKCLLAYVDSPDGHTIEVDEHGAAARRAKAGSPLPKAVARAPAARKGKERNESPRKRNAGQAKDPAATPRRRA